MKKPTTSPWKLRAIRTMALGLGITAAVPALLSTADAARPCPQCDCDNGAQGTAGNGVNGTDNVAPVPDDGMNNVQPDALDDVIQPYSDYDTVAGGPLSLSPNMIGDFFGNGGQFTFGTGLPIGPGQGGYIPVAAGDRRVKISENLSPIPRDRVYVTYNNFQNAVRGQNNQDIDVNRYTGGGEKTFWDGMGSVEFRMPFASGLNARPVLGDPGNDQGTEFGNITIIPKFILSSDQNYVLSTGLGINLPTARDAILSAPNGVPLAVYQNDAVHLLPFLGLLVTPTDNTYVISFAQVDFDTNGNDVYNSFSGTHSRIQDPALLHLDLAVGSWIYRNDYSRLSGIAPQVEIHYSTTMQDFDQADGFTPITNRLDTLILTGGMNFQFFNRSNLTVGCAVPVNTNHQEEKQFDAEVQVLFNRFF
jgi:hypothetical protein